MNPPLNSVAGPARIALTALVAFALCAPLAVHGSNQSSGQASGSTAPHPRQDAPTDAGERKGQPEPIYVRMKTSMGEIVVELDQEKAPKSVENFLHYVNERFYDGLIFHRVIPQFMIQGGGFSPDMQQKRPSRTPVKNEWQNGLKNKRGTIALARTANPDSATSQFFINVVDNPDLDRPVSGGAGYAVFGKVIHGMKAVDKIRNVPTHTVGPHRNVPREPVIIEEIRRLSADDAKEYLEDRETPAPSEPSDPTPSADDTAGPNH